MYWIVCDASADLPKEYVQAQQKLKVLPMPYHFGDKEGIYGPEVQVDMHEFYEALRNGATSGTAQTNSATFYETFKELSKDGDGILCIMMGGVNSGSLSSAQTAAKAFKEANPQIQLEVLDSTCMSLGYGMLVMDAVKLRDEGISLEDNTAKCRQLGFDMLHWFTVDDLHYLARGGRLSKFTAIAGSRLRIKPVLHVDAEGRLVTVGKVNGRKKAIRTICDSLLELMDEKEKALGATVYIAHADCLEDARWSQDYLTQQLGEQAKVHIGTIGCVIGAHSGPGTLAIFAHGAGNGR
jgi:DegV family protein with EDD domain